MNSKATQKNVKLSESTPKTAKKRDLERLRWLPLDVSKAPAGLRGAPFRLWGLIDGLQRLGYGGISAPIGSISDNLARITRSAASERTVYRALSDLEARGLIRRSRAHFGDRFGLCSILFLYDTRLHLPKRQTLDRTEIQSIDQTDTYCVKSSASKAKRSNQRKEGGKVHRINPVLFTLRIVCRGRRDASELLAAAAMELAAGSGPSGLDWAALGRAWGDTTPTEREHLARTMVLPALERLKGQDSKTGQRRSARSGDRVLAHVSGAIVPDRPSRAVFERLARSVAKTVESVAENGSELSPAELAVLAASDLRVARARAERDRRDYAPESVADLLRKQEKRVFGGE